MAFLKLPLDTQLPPALGESTISLLKKGYPRSACSSKTRTRLEGFCIPESLGV